MKHAIILDCIMFFFFGMTTGDAILRPDIFNVILLAINAPFTGMYIGLRFMDYLLKKKGYVKLDGKIYDLRSRV